MKKYILLLGIFVLILGKPTEARDWTLVYQFSQATDSLQIIHEHSTTDTTSCPVSGDNMPDSFSVVDTITLEEDATNYVRFEQYIDGFSTARPTQSWTEFFDLTLAKKPDSSVYQGAAGSLDSGAVAGAVAQVVGDSSLSGGAGTGANAVTMYATDTSNNVRVNSVTMAAYSTDYSVQYGLSRIPYADSGLTFSLDDGTYRFVAISSGYSWNQMTLVVDGAETDSVTGYPVTGTYPLATKTCLVSGTILTADADSVGGLPDVVINIIPSHTDMVDSAGNIIAIQNRIFAKTNSSGQWSAYVPYTNYIIPPAYWTFKGRYPGGYFEAANISVPSQSTGTLKKDSSNKWVIE